MTRASSSPAQLRISLTAALKAALQKWQQKVDSVPVRLREEFARAGIIGFGRKHAPLVQWIGMIAVLDPRVHISEAIDMFNEWSDHSATSDSDKFMTVAFEHGLAFPRCARKGPVWHASDIPAKLLLEGLPYISEHMRLLGKASTIPILSTRLLVLHEVICFVALSKN